MKCPKCNYTSFDFNRACPKCGNDNTEEQTRLNLSPNKPNPPFFLASLMGTEGSLNLEIPTDGAPIPSSGAASEEMDAQDLLIAMDDLHSDNAKPDSQEPLVPSTDEIVFDTDDSKEETLEPLALFDPEEDEILFDLEPASEEDEIESIGIDPLDKKGFSDFQAPDEKPVAVEAVEIQEETGHIIDETDLFLTDESVTLEIPAEKTGSAAMDDMLEEPDSQELFLSLDDLPGGETKSDTSASTRIEDDDITFELEEAPGKKGFWDSEEIEKQVAAFELEENGTKTMDTYPKKATDEKMEVNVFSDLDIEPLDLELSLDDVEKKS